jgi:hypothetical protein
MTELRGLTDEAQNVTVYLNFHDGVTDVPIFRLDIFKEVKLKHPEP